MVFRALEWQQWRLIPTCRAYGILCTLEASEYPQKNQGLEHRPQIARLLLQGHLTNRDHEFRERAIH